MAFTTDQLAAIETAIATGALTVTYNGRSTTFQSTAQLLRLRDRMLRELSGDKRTLTHKAAFQRG